MKETSGESGYLLRMESVVEDVAKTKCMDLEKNLCRSAKMEACREDRLGTDTVGDTPIGGWLKAHYIMKNGAQRQCVV